MAFDRRLPPWALVALLVLGTTLLPGCLHAPTAADWQAVGFQTPRQAFRTFQTGMRADDPDLEYRSLSGGFKRRAGVSQTLYREFREELLRGAPWLRLAARARVTGTRVLAPDRVRVVAEVRALFRRETFEVELVREDFYELWVDGERVDDDAVPWEELAREEDGDLVVRVPLGELAWLDVGQLVAGHEWKIDGFPGATDVGAPSP